MANLFYGTPSLKQKNLNTKSTHDPFLEWPFIKDSSYSLQQPMITQFVFAFWVLQLLAPRHTDAGRSLFRCGNPVRGLRLVAVGTYRYTSGGLAVGFPSTSRLPRYCRSVGPLVRGA